MSEIEEEVKPVDNIEVDASNISTIESLLRDVVLQYEDAWNNNNEKYELKYILTITNHKIPTPEGNKDVAYLRLQRAVRKVANLDAVSTDAELIPSEEEKWSEQLIHQEAYFFKNIQEQANPKAPWRDQLYLNCIARLISAGLEYAELLQRLKKANLTKEQPKSNIEIATEMPKPLTASDEKYKEWLSNERKKEGL